MSQHERNDEIVESVDQMIRMWSIFAGRFPDAKVEALPGITVTLSGTPMVFVNLIHLSSPVRDRDDLTERCRMAIAYGKASGAPWLFSACDPWLGDPEVAEEVLSGLGLTRQLGTKGMVTDTLLPPQRSLPAELEIRRVNDEETRYALSDLNMLSYGMPIPLGRDAIGRSSYWHDSFYAYVGFVNGEPVSCTLTSPVDGRLYVAWVATHPDHRRKGYGDAVMRRSLEEARAATGLRRTVLHATDMGYPVYEAMGYHSVVGFSWYALG
ncbi:GNAT family N-acetyltransferase [Polyangium sp. y55x31]|uniref:GNAT family N-acetyltransferase n=1 Tax=Polyangium sp. y55x31 TaxID=3042688 RepID=UPI0024827E72|nr:GNAT family N-acetyltransferase [Polyangium sp. y55x31]MDI1482712.1 GNAT family N-acetyltransferase [Polyangium sp. y55x31]